MPDIFASTKTTTPKAQNKVLATPGTKRQSAIHPRESHFHALSSFCIDPRDITFQTQEKDEELLLLLRAHFITNFGWIFITIVLLFVPIVFASLIPTSLPPPFDSISPQYIFVFILLYYLSVAAYAYINFITWFYNLMIVTNKRIVTGKQIGRAHV